MIDKQEVHTKVQAYLSDNNKIIHSISNTIDFIFTTPLEVLAYSPKKLPDASIYELTKNRSDYVKILVSLDLPSSYPYRTLSEGMNPETETAIAEFIHSVEVKPSKKLLVDLMNQKSIQDLIANIIESGIIEFNKKTNPLFGMIQATGLDKQIKSFINMFLPNFLPQIAEFLYNTSLGKDSTMSKDIAVLVMNAPLAELNLPDAAKIEIAEVKLKELREKLSQDTILQNTIKDYHLSVQNKFLEQFGKENLKSFLKLPESEYEQFKQTTSAYIASEISNYHSKNDLSQIVSDIIIDILSS